MGSFERAQQLTKALQEINAPEPYQPMATARPVGSGKKSRIDLSDALALSRHQETMRRNAERHQEWLVEQEMEIAQRQLKALDVSRGMIIDKIKGSVKQSNKSLWTDELRAVSKKYEGILGVNPRYGQFASTIKNKRQRAEADWIIREDDYLRTHGAKPRKAPPPKPEEMSVQDYSTHLFNWADEKAQYESFMLKREVKPKSMFQIGSQDIETPNGKKTEAIWAYREKDQQGDPQIVTGTSQELFSEPYKFLKEKGMSLEGIRHQFGQYGECRIPGTRGEIYKDGVMATTYDTIDRHGNRGRKKYLEGDKAGGTGFTSDAKVAAEKAAIAESRLAEQQALKEYNEKTRPGKSMADDFMEQMALVREAREGGMLGEYYEQIFSSEEFAKAVDKEKHPKLAALKLGKMQEDYQDNFLSAQKKYAPPSFFEYIVDRMTNVGMILRNAEEVHSAIVTSAYDVLKPFNEELGRKSRGLYRIIPHPKHEISRGFMKRVGEAVTPSFLGDSFANPPGGILTYKAVYGNARLVKDATYDPKIDNKYEVYIDPDSDVVRDSYNEIIKVVKKKSDKDFNTDPEPLLESELDEWMAKIDYEEYLEKRKKVTY